MGPSRQQQMVGLDVSKAWLDGYLPATGRRLRVGNDPAGIGKFLQILGDRTGCLVVMEASGGYERTAHRELVAQGVLAAIVNPSSAERSIRPRSGRRRRRRRAGARLRPRHGPGSQDRPGRCQADRPLWRGDAPGRHASARPGPPGAARDPGHRASGPIPRRDVSGADRRRQLVDEITVRKQQLEHLTSPAVRARVEQALTFLREEAKALLALLRARIAADAALAADFALLTSMPGCGPILAATLLAELPELGTLDRRKVAALAGLAPVAKDSGLREHRRVIKGGRGQVRNALDMAVLASLKTDKSLLKARYAQLTAKGKPPKLALAALMRKMLVTLNAMLKARTSWQDPRQK